MNKNFIKTKIIIWSIIVVFLIGILIYGVTYKKDFGFNFNISNIVSINVGGKNLKTQKDKTISLDGCNNINLDFRSSDVIIKETNDSKIRVIEKCSTKLREKEKFQVDKSGDSINIKRGIRHSSFGIVFFGVSGQKIEVYIPKQYNKNLKINLTSGDIKFDSNIGLNMIKSTQSSGDFYGMNSIKANEFNLESTSGDVQIGNLNTNIYNIELTSGDIMANLVKGSGNVKATSGDIKIQYKDINDYSNVKASSGDVNLKINKKINFDFSGKCGSGEINSDFPINYNNQEEKDEGTGKIGDDPYKRIDVQTSSGDINLEKIY
ncbi:DUF4097 family beta strand repeat-containing protein [Clostridium oceanicum]|uniref:DUF4097 domain-containing protein n=1 Tax=Clostridium oceanicum TaxID=1543 RepID=A0ABN1JEL6_9CLOT